MAMKVNLARGGRGLRLHWTESKHVRLATFLTYAFLIVVNGCATIPQQIERYLQKEQYENALALLEKKGAGSVPSEDAKQQAMVARNLYSNAVSERFVQHAEEVLIKEGKARKAYKIICKGHQLCQWSVTLTNAKKKHAKRIEHLEQLTVELDSLLISKPISIEQARLALDKLVSVQHVMRDSPPLVQHQEKSRLAVVTYWANHIVEKDCHLSQSEIDISVDDLSLITTDKSKLTTFEQALLLTSKLPTTGDSEQNSLTPQQEGNIRSLAKVVGNLQSTTSSEDLLKPYSKAITRCFSKFCMEDFGTFLESPKVSIETITIAEQLYTRMPDLDEGRYCSSLSCGHLHRAKYRASQGKAAGLALLHLKRAQTLDPSLTQSRESDLDRLCRASLRAALPVRMSISIDGNTSIDPTVYKILRIVLATHLISGTQSHWEWEWLDPLKKNCVVRLYIDRAQLISTSIDDLSVISSEYLSHYQDVPNPLKNSRKIQLNYYKTCLDLAESHYEYAVSAHNSYPTYYSLQNANNAYNSYVMALNTYNNWVGIYNATPDTISSPVFLPYTFVEGTVKSGWTVDMTVRVAEHSFAVAAESIESDFVRIGTRLADKSQGYRRDDPLSIDVSTTRLFEQLGDVCTKVNNSVARAIVHAPIETIAELTDEEHILLSYVLHPFDKLPDEIPQSDDISWGVELTDQIVLPEKELLPVEQLLTTKSSILCTQRSAKDIAAIYEPLVCEIRSTFARGSGVLISVDGLILTCAHVLFGADSKAIFHSGSLKGEHQLEIVFVNETQDVAIARVTGIVPKTWASIRLENQCAKGEQIVAIGNPSLADRTVSYGALSEGIVSNPLVKMKDGQERLVCDITIAQGSSGGPLVSMETGEVVGIVTHIVEAAINPEPRVSTSGYSCLAAPAFQFTDWLGISYPDN